jgi:hypothetical protein
MFAETVVTIADPDPPSGADLRALRSWLSGEEELRGRVRLRSEQPQPGTLGALPEALVVAGPLVVALVPALISWIRSRHTEVSVELTGPDGRSVKITAGQVRRMGAPELTRMINDTVRSFTAAPSAGAPLESGSAAELGG